MKPPILVGILNATPDSFSDGGCHLAPEAALRRARELQAAGAHWLDIGAESTRPGFTPVSPEEELRRLLPVLEAITSELHLPISIDTSKPAVAKEALAHGATIINDVDGLHDPTMLRLVQQTGCGVILMRGKDFPLDPADAAPAATTRAYFAKRLQQIALPPEQHLLLDPGIGFACTREQDLALLENVSLLRDLGHDLFIGVSRKRVTHFAFPEMEREAASAALAGLAWQQGATHLRMHDLAAFQTWWNQHGEIHA